MRIQHVLPGYLFILLASGCLAPDDDLVEDDDGEVPVDPDATIQSYSAWQTYAAVGGYPNIQFRSCKTSTQIHWQFQNNHGFSEVITRGNSGSSMGALSSNISGVSAGSKYRTRGNATWFNVQYNGSGIALITGQPISQIPSC